MSSVSSINNAPTAFFSENVEASLRALPEALPPIRDGRAVWREVFRMTRPTLVRATLNALATAAFSSCSALVAMRILDPGASTRARIAYSVGFFALNLAAHLTVRTAGRLRADIALATENFLTQRIARKLLALSSDAVGRQSTGTIKVLITSDVKSVGNFLDNCVRNLIPALAALVVTVPFLVHLSGTAGVVGVLTMTSLLPFAMVLNAWSTRLRDRGQAELDSLTSLLGEWVKHVRLVRYLSWNEAIRSEARGKMKRYLSVSGLNHFLACVTFGLNLVWWMVSVTSVMVYARTSGRGIDLVAFFGSLWFLTYLSGYFTHLPMTLRFYAQAVPSVRRIAHVLGETEESDAFRAVGPDLGGYRPVRIRCSGVGLRFGGEGERWILRGLDLTLELDRKVALIGEVASGKTSLLRLLSGEIAPSEGKIEIDFSGGPERPGEVVTADLWSKNAHAAWRAHIAVAPSEPFVSNDSISRNLSLGDALADDVDGGRALEAAEFAELTADLALFRNGIHEEIGESGVNLSGGQRQRLSIARAIYSGRDYRLLDDPLSALDGTTEAALMARLHAEPRGYLLVTHRMGELRAVSEVCVLAAGRILERGAPDVLARDSTSELARVLRAYGARDV